ncbi:hypothetical protein BGX31_001223 [Mortierella sp. GBA43]|nr:hypothetical protein BGX31_001223 [Mortierella sp. GBA43]
MSASTTTQPAQEFRCRSTDKVLEIATYLDHETGERTILWETIQAKFENVKSIRDGKSGVSFLRDAHLKEITPRRIAYHPGTVLDVIVDDDFGYGHGHCDRLSHDHNQFGPETTLPHVTQNFCQNTAAVTRTAVMLTNSVTGDKSLVPYSSSMAGSRSSAVIFDTPFEDVVSNQNTKQPVSPYMQHQIERIQKILDMADEEHAKRYEKMKETLRKQQEEEDLLRMMALDRLAYTQSRVQAMVTRIYELHESPIPRLFIVLPRTMGAIGTAKNPLANHFRLYFLCECGSHTIDEGSKTPHEIHFAKHEGYDLEKPTEFFERYGSYALTFMNMIKYGVSAAGLTVPPLEGLKIVDGIDTTQQDIDYLKKNLAALVDESINYLEGIKSKTNPGEEIAQDHAESEQLEVLQGADLKQLESYLKVKDKGRVLANLYRIVTTDGHVKWVCFDHYKATCRQSAILGLRAIVKTNRGTFIEETGTIQIKIATGALAKQFYDAILLSNAIIEANVVHVTMNGSCFKGPALDVANRNQRFNPILQLAFNSRIQSLRLDGFDGFFSRITKSSLGLASKLRAFRYDAPITSKGKDLQTIDDFLGRCPALTTLELSLDPQQLITNTMSKILKRIQTLESLRISREELSITAGFSKGKIKTVDLTIPRLGDLDDNDLKFVRREHLAQLSIKDVQSNEVDQLEELLRGTTSLKHLQIGCHYESSLTVVDRVISTREKIIQDTGSSCLQTFELMKESLVPFSTTSHDESDHIQSRISFQDGSNDFDMRSWIRQSDKTALEFVRRYGWSIVFYDGGLQTHVSSSDILDGFGDTRTPQLESVRIRSCVAANTDLDQIMRRSPNFKDVGLAVDLEDDDFIPTQTMLSRSRQCLSLLSLWGGTVERWSLIASSFPTRDKLPLLESFMLRYPLSTRLPSNFIRWIVAMVSARAPQEPVNRAIINRHIPHVKSVTQKSWTLLKRIGLDFIQLHALDWRRVIEAIDFSELQILSFRNTNLILEGLQLLVDRIPDNKVPLEILDIRYTPAACFLESRPLLLDELRRKAPLVTIMTEWR